MEYPEALYCNGRKKLDKAEIFNSNYLYARHKPGYDWIEEEGLPDFSKIKIDPKTPSKNQSFNWDRFSEPHWVRFNPQKEYLKEYAVVGFLVETIRNLKQTNCELENDLVDVEHEPVNINYSHCQLVCLERLKKKKQNKKIRRAIRMAMKHNSKVVLKPNEEINLADQLKSNLT